MEMHNRRGHFDGMASDPAPERYRVDRGNNIDDHDSTEELDDEDDFNEIEDLGVDDGLDDEGLYEEELEETDSRNDGSDRFRQSSSHLEVIDLSDVETDNIALTPDNDEGFDMVWSDEDAPDDDEGSDVICPDEDAPAKEDEHI